MGQSRLFTEEDVYACAATGLRRAGIDAVSTWEVQRVSQSDESQLTWGTSHGRAIVTFNVRDFAVLNRDWLATGKSHAGIIVSQQISLGEVARWLLNLVAKLDDAAMLNRLEFLSDW